MHLTHQDNPACALFRNRYMKFKELLVGLIFGHLLLAQEAHNATVTRSLRFSEGEEEVLFFLVRSDVM